MTSGLFSLRLALLTGISALALPGLAQQPATKPGASIALNLGGGWTSNPTEVSTRERGDVTARQDLTLGYRIPLWSGATAYLGTSAGSTFYVREHATGTHRVSFSASVAQVWHETSFTLGYFERKAMNSRLTAHDSASRELGLSASRTFTLREGLTLNLFARGARRFHFNGSENQWRAGVNATLAQKFGAWTARLGGGWSYMLEDNTYLLPRINDRSVFAHIGIGYALTKEIEIGLRAGFWRTYSTYPFDRYKSFSLGPTLSANWQF